MQARVDSVEVNGRWCLGLDRVVSSFGQTRVPLTFHAECPESLDTNSYYLKLLAYNCMQRAQHRTWRRNLGTLRHIRQLRKMLQTHLMSPFACAIDVCSVIVL
jgi:hypothetical protein